jgi:hypothetical protein
MQKRERERESASHSHLDYRIHFVCLNGIINISMNNKQILQIETNDLFQALNKFNYYVIVNEFITKQFHIT